jgi:hypothetical protein
MLVTNVLKAYYVAVLMTLFDDDCGSSSKAACVMIFDGLAGSGDDVADTLVWHR